MKFITSIVVGIIGIGFTVLNCFSVMRTITEGVMMAKRLTALPTRDASQLSAVIGETVIAVSCCGMLTILPALLIYITLVPLRLRSRWFYRWAFASSIYFILVPPFATILGLILLTALRRRRSEFREVAGYTSELDMSLEPLSEQSLTKNSTPSFTSDARPL